MSLPSPVLPEYLDETKCRRLRCENDAPWTCGQPGCETKYCSERCQKADSRSHVGYCGRQVYQFEIEIQYSEDPVITRVVDVPAWFTFQEFHFAVQYAFAWQHCHLHEWTFEDDSLRGREKIVLRINGDDDYSEDMDSDDYGPRAPSVSEQEATLSDVYDASGRYFPLVHSNGEAVPLIYSYDFGDCWDHLIRFKGVKAASCNRPLFISATGYHPADDAGGVGGWEEVKKAFAAPHPTSDQLRRRRWAVDRMNLQEGQVDPRAEGSNTYSPFNVVDVMAMNDPGLWKRHLIESRLELAERRLQYN